MVVGLSVELGQGGEGVGVGRRLREGLDQNVVYHFSGVLTLPAVESQQS